MSLAVLILHAAACTLLALFGAHRVWLLVDYLRAKKNARQVAAFDLAADAPVVTVQLPMFNESGVAVRLIDAVCQLEWPKSALEIQVLDDSTDHTRDLVAAAVARWRAKGVDVKHLHRTDRTGFKAGALAAGTAQCRGELIAIFDADFVPPKRFLVDTVGAFADPDVDMVQARWGHLNRGHSWLTDAQAVFLDAHFTIEHGARDAHRRFFNFNGTAGIWRRRAIDDAGGWDAATLTEDLDLSFRAQLAGSRFAYLDHVEVPAELPEDVAAFKAQQHRWAKGSMQTLRRLAPKVLAARLPVWTRADALLKLGQNLAFLLLALVVATMPVVALVRATATTPFERAFDLATLGLATLPVAIHFLIAQRERHVSWGRIVVSIPLAIGLGGALSINNARAVLEGLFGRGRDPFVRTPKKGEKKTSAYRLPTHPLVLVEFVLGVSHIAAAILIALEGALWTTPFLWMIGGALLALSLASVPDVLRARLPSAKSPAQG